MNTTLRHGNQSRKQRQRQEKNAKNYAAEDCSEAGFSGILTRHRELPNSQGSIIWPSSSRISKFGTPHIVQGQPSDPSPFKSLKSTPVQDVMQKHEKNSPERQLNVNADKHLEAVSHDMDS